MRLAREHLQASARHGERHPGQRRQRQLRHAHRRRGGPRHRARPLAKAAASCPHRRFCPPPPASSASNWTPPRSSARPARAWSTASRRTASSDVARAIMTTDLVPKTAFRRSRLRRGTVRIRRHDQGLRHDPSQHGDHARLRHDRRRRSAAHLRAMLEARRRAQLQPHLGGWRHVHQRHARAAGQRRLGRATRPRRSARSSRKAVTRVMRGPGRADRPRRRGRPQADHHRQWRRAADERRRAHRPRHRQFAAGEDRHRRLATPTGAASSPPPATRGVAFDPRKVDIDMQGVPVCRGGLAAEFSEERTEDEARRARVPHPLRHPRRRQGRGPLLDLRPHRGLHRDQRQLPDLSPLARRSRRTRAKRRAVRSVPRWVLRCAAHPLRSLTVPVR